MGNIFAAQIQAMEATIFCVESTVMQGYASLQIVGNISKVCDDGRERAKAALEACGFSIPAKRIIISISPADQRKEGSQFDLPLAVSILEQISERKTRLEKERWLFAGELGLNGEIRAVKGIIPFALAAIRHGLHGIIISIDNLEEAATLYQLHTSALPGFRILAARTLQEVIQWLREPGSEVCQLQEPQSKKYELNEYNHTYDDMELSPELESAALVAATGKHNVLLRGVPGSGKSMWATRLPSLLNHLPPARHLEVLNIHSVHHSHLDNTILAGLPPSRSPHHQASSAAVIGSLDSPGDLALAHHGVLFLDEVTEFRRDVLEALREPLETGSIHLSRSKAKVTWPAQVLLVAACNNCPCGWFGSSVRRCTCSVSSLLNYQKKLSGPLLDRIDMHLHFDQPVSHGSQIFIQSDQTFPKTQRLRDRVCKAQDFGRKRNEQLQIYDNCELKAEHMLKASNLTESKFKTILEYIFKNQLSTRSRIRILRVARSIADLHDSLTLRPEHMQQALQWSDQAQSSPGGLPQGPFEGSKPLRSPYHGVSSADLRR